MAKHFGMVIDTRRCMACHTCIIGCKSENYIPDGIVWNNIATVGSGGMDCPSGDFPNVKMHAKTIACQHCENPACARVCPVGATYKDKETGVVRQDYDKCIGCRMCMAACPYTGVRSFNWEEPKYSVGFRYGNLDAPEHQKHTVEKCTFCWHRLAKGKNPICTEVCPARARKFGDLNDSMSEVSRLLATRRWEQLLPEKGTRPSVYYLV